MDENETDPDEKIINDGNKMKKIFQKGTNQNDFHSKEIHVCTKIDFHGKGPREDWIKSNLILGTNNFMRREQNEKILFR